MTEPENGVPFVIDTDRGLARCADALSMGEGPVAIDAERASGFRYGQRAFLVQLKREGSGLWLIDPEAFSTLAPLQDSLGEAEWILHAAGQDLPCLAEVGLSPHALFDTELAARLAGLPRVGLGAVVEGRLGARLAKEHSAADWSRRPLPEDWLRYAALDVDLLIPLRNNLEALLREDGKLEWARAEFEHLRVTPTTGTPLDARWRKTSKLSRLKSPRKLAILRELWMTRELFAQSKDVAPGHVLPDSALVAAAEASPRTVPQLLAVDGFHGRAAKRQAPRWLHAIQTGAKTQELPEMRLPASGPPAPRLWRDRNPLAFRQYRTARQWIADRAEALNMMPEVLLTPAVLKAVCWEPPEKIDLNTVSEALRNQGARAWQIEQCAAVLTVALLDPDPLESL